jgi:hypothetical protein
MMVELFCCGCAPPGPAADQTQASRRSQTGGGQLVDIAGLPVRFSKSAGSASTEKVKVATNE